MTLTHDDRVAIRKAFIDGEQLQVIADRHGTTRATVANLAAAAGLPPRRARVTEHQDTSWRDRAACASSYNPDFFPQELHVLERPEARERAKAICRACDVLEQCRQFAGRVQPSGGIWAGQEYNAQGEQSQRRGSAKVEAS